MGERFWNWYHVWDRVQSNLIEEDFWIGLKQIIKRILAQPGAAEWWSLDRFQFPQNFVDEVDELANGDA